STVSRTEKAAAAADGQPSTQTAVKGDSTMLMTDYRVIPFKTITGHDSSLADFHGKVVLIVNVASQCGFTPQYKDLEVLYEKYKDRGFVVIGFPANNFGSQEPGTNEDILKFCSTTYSVTFPMMAKVSVKGDDKHPLFKYLTEESPVTGEVKWNFSKFLLDRQGNLVARYPSETKPLDPKLTGRIETLF
ncbi:MAG TPA: glutathione peroxidase, partial [Candidatus Acidoferrum sp.]|nr:glutathione peroxidase [Candidatus Acidoferrum sp.]